MDNAPENNSQTLLQKDTEKILKNVMVVAIISVILGVAGTGFGIYSTIQVNRSLGYIQNYVGTDLSDLDEATDAEDAYGTPASADSINSVSIFYNNGEDYIDINDSNQIEYYTVDNNGEYVGDTLDINSAEIFKYIFDNDAQYLGSTNYDGNEVWSLEVESDEGYSIIGGTTDDEPQWFKDLLTKLEADKKGYKSKTLSE